MLCNSFDVHSVYFVSKAEEQLEDFLRRVRVADAFLVLGEEVCSNWNGVQSRTPAGTDLAQAREQTWNTSTV
jgi:hypothetical protein